MRQAAVRLCVSILSLFVLLLVTLIMKVSLLHKLQYSIEFRESLQYILQIRDSYRSKDKIDRRKIRIYRSTCHFSTTDSHTDLSIHSLSYWNFRTALRPQIVARLKSQSDKGSLNQADFTIDWIAPPPMLSLSYQGMSRGGMASWTVLQYSPGDLF